MEDQYQIIYTKSMYKDLNRIKKFIINPAYYEYTVERIDEDIKNLTSIPRMHKTIYKHNDKNTEYRRIVSGKYIIIYKIEKKQVIILRIFSHKQDYLNPESFILRENPSFYNIKLNKRREDESEFIIVY